MNDSVLTAVKNLYQEFGVTDIEPIYALIVDDCREKELVEKTGSFSGCTAIYLGDFDFPSIHRTRFTDPDMMEQMHDALCVHPEEYGSDTEFDIGNPLLLTETGQLIWGIESYWAPIEGSPDLARAQIDYTMLAQAFISNDAVEGLRAMLLAESECDD